jgi:hypothetical protein
MGYGLINNDYSLVTSQRRPLAHKLVAATPLPPFSATEINAVFLPAPKLHELVLP